MFQKANEAAPAHICVYVSLSKFLSPHVNLRVLWGVFMWLTNYDATDVFGVKYTAHHCLVHITKYTHFYFSLVYFMAINP